MAKNGKVVNILNGSIEIGHRPKLSSFSQLKHDGFTHVVTILSEKEGAKKILENADHAGLFVIWIPLGNANPVTDQVTLKMIASIFDEISLVLKNGGKIYMHCSAGIHRTGMIAYALLNYLGFERIEALKLLREIREVTFEGVGEERLRWGEQFHRK